MLQVSRAWTVNGNFTVHNVHFIIRGNMASNADREIDEVREERLRRRKCDKLRREKLMKKDTKGL